MKHQTDSANADGIRPSEACPTVSGVEQNAAGLPAVAVSIRRTVGAAGAFNAGRAMLKINQIDGFDCPGCAWPERADRKFAEFCESGAKAVAEEATRKRAGASFFAQHAVSVLESADDLWLGKQGRLVEPMIRRPGSTHFEPISYASAYDLIAAALRAVADANQAVFYTSGRTSNEAAYCYQLLARSLGTNNLPDCSNMCHEPTSVAMADTIGVGKGTVTFDHFDEADVIILMGQNPGTNHPRMLSTLEEAKRRGARIVAINPMPEAGLMRFKNPQNLRGLFGNGTGLADLYCAISLNGDLALMLLINKRLVASGDIDAEFISKHTDGFATVRDYLETLDETELLRMTGLGASVVDELVEHIRSTDRIIVCWAMGITQHRNAVATIQEIVNLSLLKGLIGRPGAGLCPVRGHSNVQGDRTMGVSEKPEPDFMERLSSVFGFAPPTQKGLDVVSAIHALTRGEIRVLMSMGGNLARAAPDSGITEAALRNCALSVHVATKLNRTHVIAGETSILLPTLGRTERDVRGGTEQVVTVEDSFGFVHISQGRLAPPGPNVPSEVDIVCQIALRAVSDKSSAPWSQFAESYDAVRDFIAATVSGFEAFNRRVRVGVGFSLPHPGRDSRTFPTDTGRAKLTVNRLRQARPESDGVLLQTLRSHDQYNTTIYGLSDRYRGIEGGRLVIFINRIDLDRLSLTDGEIVDVLTSDGSRRTSGFRLVEYPVAVGSAAGYYPELNRLVSLDSFDVASRTPAFKSVPVRFERHKS